MAVYESKEELERVIGLMSNLMMSDEKLLRATAGADLTVGFTIPDLGSTFSFRFEGGRITADIGPEVRRAQVKLSTDSDTFHRLFSGELNPVAAAMSGRIAFGGELELAMGLLGVVDELKRIYAAARAQG